MGDSEQFEQRLESISKKVDQTARLARENNRILLQMRRNARIGRAMTILYWVITVAVMVGLYYYIQPYLEGLAETYSQGVENLQRF